jgi:serpin B
MSSTRDQHIARRPGYKVLKLPYATAPGTGGQHRAFSMYIYLPDDCCGLPSLLQNLCCDPTLLENSGTMGSKVSVGTFMVPKFTISCGTDAKEMLKVLGLTLPFDPILADLSEMAESLPEPLFVLEVHHMCFVEVNEQGTEAAAAIAVRLLPGCALCIAPPEDFVADHPLPETAPLPSAKIFAGSISSGTRRIRPLPSAALDKNTRQTADLPSFKRPANSNTRQNLFYLVLYTRQR